MKSDLFVTSISIVTNIIFIFGFLLIFYFIYVVNVEQQTFKTQMNIIVDSISDDVQKEKFIDPIEDDNEKVVIYGLIDTAKEKIKLSTKEQAEQISEQNLGIETNIFTIFGIVFGLLLLLFLIFRNIIPHFEIIKQTLIIVFFVGLTEVMFLTFISSKYISSDPNKVKFMLGNSVTNWLKINKPTIP